jgi:prepilin-type processing-associated H-X9-DG protein
MARGGSFWVGPISSWPHAVALYNCPSRRGPTKGTDVDTNTGKASYLIDYAGAIGGIPRSENQTWYTNYMAEMNAYRSNSATNISQLAKNNLFWGCENCTSALPAQGEPVIIRGVIQRSDHQGDGYHAGWGITVSFQQIQDGASNTMLIGEKRLVPSKYQTGEWHDDRGWIDGWDPDTMRSTMFPVSADNEEADNSLTNMLPYSFGSAHSSGINCVFADGSVHTISYDIDPDTFIYLGNREDNEPLDLSKL